MGTRWRRRRYVQSEWFKKTNKLTNNLEDLPPRALCRKFHFFSEAAFPK
jgi:hypothetical protein